MTKGEFSTHVTNALRDDGTEHELAVEIANAYTDLVQAMFGDFYPSLAEQALYLTGQFFDCVTANEIG